MQGDTLETSDGIRLTGRIESISTGRVAIVTISAGTVTVTRCMVTRLAIDAPVNLALASGERRTGRFEIAPGGKVAIMDGTNGLRQVVAAGAIASAWLTNAPDPTVTAPVPGHIWKHSLAFDLNGKRGNSKAVQAGGAVDATLVATNLDLKFYSRGAYGETEEVVSDRTLVGGIDLEWRYSGRWSWYTRDELLKDDILGIRARNVLASGLGYELLKNDVRELRLRLGVGHIYTAYNDPGRQNESAVSLDSGLRFRDKLDEYVTWATDVTFQPSTADFANFYFTQESRLVIPLAAHGLTQEFGVANQYASRPGANRDTLDTTYFARTRYAW